MVNPAICRKCLHCEGIEPPLRDGDSLIAEVIVHCGLLLEDLLVSSETPIECPYKLEHTLLGEQMEMLKEGWDAERMET